MTKETIRQALQDIFRDVFDQDDLVLEDATGQDDVRDWDSMAQISILSCAEQEFGVKFDLNEVMSLSTVGDIVDLIARKV